MSHLFRIATRASALALWQARHVAELLVRTDAEAVVELVEVTTAGDRVLSQPLRQFGGQGAFTREVQTAVLEGRADLAVHSLKDLPTEPTPGLVLAAVPARGDTDDVLVMPAGSPLTCWEQLPQSARVGTGSPRRQAQLRALRPDLQIHEIRGNVETRLRKLDAGEFDALVLAAAGLIRLGRESRITQRLRPPAMYHAVGQGAIGVECRADDRAAIDRLAAVADRATWSAVVAERSLLSTLRAGCHAPVGVATTMTASQLRLEAVVLSLDGSRRWWAAAERPLEEAAALGTDVAQQMLRQGATEVLTLP